VVVNISFAARSLLIEAVTACLRNETVTRRNVPTSSRGCIHAEQGLHKFCSVQLKHLRRLLGFLICEKNMAVVL
jgi:hypothetical protein